MRDPAATTPQQITERVLRSFDDCPDDRLRELMQGLAGHLHAFASEVGLTGEEWERAIATLTRDGRRCCRSASTWCWRSRAFAGVNRARPAAIAAEWEESQILMDLSPSARAGVG